MVTLMREVGEVFERFVNALWGNWLLYVLVGLGIFYTIVSGFVQVRRIPFIVKSLFNEKKFKKSEEKEEGNSFTSIQALLAAIASCVGSGNIVGVSTAILAGGPGALFWMWVAAFFGMATKFGEIVLGICHRGKDEKGEYIGGPMYYISKVLKAPWIGSLVAVLLFIQNAGGTLVQSNTITSVIHETFAVPKIIGGILLAIFMFFIIKGGFKRLVTVAEILVPFMAGLYIVGGFIVVLTYYDRIPTMFSTILSSAFSYQAAGGAAIGFTMKQAMRYGVTRGLYSNEAGEGSAAVLHSTVEIDHPVRQGIYGVIEVFVDTMVICSTTGFVVLISGVNLTHTNAATLAAEAFGSVAPLMRYVVSISLILFAFTSLMSQWYFGHVSLQYLKVTKADMIYCIIYPIAIIYGGFSEIEWVWLIQDLALGLLIIPNIIAMIVAAPKVRRLTKEFFKPENGYLD